MNKEEVLYMFNKYKDRPVEIDTGDSAAVLRGNIDGHWLFMYGDSVIEVKKNTPDGTFNIANTNQPQCPFKVTAMSIDAISYIRSVINTEAGDVEKQIGDLEPVGTSKSIKDILTEMETDSIYHASSARGFLNADENAPGTMYGQFRGSVLSTDIGGVPENTIKTLLDTSNQ